MLGTNLLHHSLQVPTLHRISRPALLMHGIVSLAHTLEMREDLVVGEVGGARGDDFHCWWLTGVFLVVAGEARFVGGGVIEISGWRSQTREL